MNKTDYFYTHLAAIVVNLAVILILFATRGYIPPQVPLLYGNPTGERQIVNKNFLSLPLLIAAVIVVINLAITHNIKDKFLKQTLAVLSLSTTLLAAITVLKILFLVGNI